MEPSVDSEDNWDSPKKSIGGSKKSINIAIDASLLQPIERVRPKVLPI